MLYIFDIDFLLFKRMFCGFKISFYFCKFFIGVMVIELLPIQCSISISKIGLSFDQFVFGCYVSSNLIC